MTLIQRLRAFGSHEGVRLTGEAADLLELLDRLHQPDRHGICNACYDKAPCATARLLHRNDA